MTDVDRKAQLERAAPPSTIVSLDTLNELPESARSAIVELETIIGRLPAPVSCWARINHGVDGFGYWSEDVGFALVKSAWRLAVRTTDGHDDSPSYENQEVLAFDEAPQSLRLRAAAKIHILVPILQAELSATRSATHGSAGNPTT